jgi:pimeloyl-ACP methyl ester carboxylesterase
MFVNVGGARVFCGTGGKPFGTLPAIVFLHGAGFDHSVWALHSRWFAHNGWSVLAPDWPGHGRSEGPPLKSIQEMARWTIAFLDAAGIREARLAGHSMGSLVALETAAKFPERISAIDLIGTGVPMAVGDELLAAAARNDAAAVAMMAIWGLGNRAVRGGSEAPGLWMLAGSERLLQSCRPGVIHTDLAACKEYAGALDAAAKVRAPAHVILGERDMMIPLKAGRALAAAIAGASLTVIPNAGHTLMAERPGELLDALRRPASADARS